MMKKLPIGIQSFRELRKGNYLYIDKTPLIYDLVESGKYFFLSRPRRFGKSLLISTLEALFSGSVELFRELWIETRWDWDKHNPVLRIDFSKWDYHTLGLEKAIKYGLNNIAEEKDIQLENTTIALQFAELIKKLSAHGKVVILIDEYDKPINDFLTDMPRAKENREILKNFYSIIKSADDYIRFMLLTGVAKFSRTSIFSVLNHLQDISLHRNYTTLCGYTQQELETYFFAHIDYSKDILKLSPAELLSEIKDWYNGYSWDGRNYLYNPFSVLQFFSASDFENFWFESGTPTFLVSLLKKRGVYDIEHLDLGPTAFNSFEIENISTHALLFQTGYLTVKRIDRATRIWTLGYPNREVKESLLQHLLGAYRESDYTTSTPAVVQLSRALLNNDIESVVDLINTLFATIPYQLFKHKSETYYHYLIHIFFTYLGQYIESEVNTSRGRCDAIVVTDKNVFMLEFKLDQSAEKALEQIRQRGYSDKFKSTGKTIIEIGINFSSEKKKVEDWATNRIVA